MLFNNTEFSKHKSKIFITCMLLILIIGIGSSFAGDVDESVQNELNDDLLSINEDADDTQQAQSGEVQQVQSNNDEDELSATNDEDLLTAPGTFTELENLVNRNRYIDLNNNYARGDYANTILCSKALIIDGHGNYLDSEKGKVIFQLHTNELIHFKNIVFKNVNAYAIAATTIHGGNIIIENCSFINTKGVISAYDYEYVEIRATFRDINIINATLSNNGAITFTSAVNAIVNNVNFTNVITTGTQSTTSKGAALSFKNSFRGEISDINCKNTSADEAGAFYFAGACNGKITNVNFTNCTARNGNGGAIYFAGQYNGPLSDLNFINCSAKNNGGAVYFSQSYSQPITNLNFINNTAYNGGALYLNSYVGGVSDVNFHGNTARSGGAIYTANPFTGDFNNVNFENNSAVDKGGAIFSSDSLNGNFKNVNFENNHATSYGGAIYSSSMNSTFEKVNVAKNTAYIYGGAFYLDNPRNLMMRDVNFTGNKVYQQNPSNKQGGGAIYIIGSSYISGSSTFLFDKINFTDNYADNCGGAIFSYGSSTEIKITNSVFHNNSAVKDGGAIYSVSFLTCDNVIFTENNASSGGAIGSHDAYQITFNVTNSQFIKNNGGAIKFYKTNGYKGYLYLSNSKFEQNYDSAVYSSFNSIISNCNFTDNHGRALYFTKGVYGYDDIVINNLDNVVCINNTASNGSAIYNRNTYLNISNSKFSLNKAQSTSISITYDKFGHVIEVEFAGGNNYINAIDSNMEVGFKNVTYNNYNVSLNSDDVYPVKSYNEVNAPISFEVYSSENELYESFNLTTPDDGIIRYSYQAPVIHHILVYHPDDDYYTYISNVYNYLWGDFDTLQQLVYNTTEGGVLELTRNFTYIIDVDTITKGVLINKSITINGNGYTINALNQSRIFKIISDDVKLNNIRFTNSTGLDGAFIYTDMSGLEVTECIFDNTGADSNVNNPFNGGAIYIVGTDNSISKSHFINLTGFNGGAIYLNSTGNNIVGCEFISSRAYNGGAIYVDSGALKTVVDDSTFTDNGAYYCGGAIYWNADEGSVKQSTFKNNTIQHGDDRIDPISIYGGGAIYWVGNSGSIAGSTFNDNKALSRSLLSDLIYGGAILLFGSNTNISDSKFNNNSAQSGGAVAIMNRSFVPLESKLAHTGYNLESLNGFNSNIINCEFTENFAQYGGAAVLSSYKNTISGSKFYENDAYLGGAVSLQGIEGLIINSTFDSNMAHIGGAVSSGYNKTYQEAYWNQYRWEYFTVPAMKFAGFKNTIDNSTFINNGADVAGAVLWMDDEGTVKNSLFKYNKVTDYYNQYSRLFNKTYSIEIPKEAYDSIHTNQYSGVEGILGGLQHSDYAGAIYWVGKHGMIMNDDFIENSAVKGGALLPSDTTIVITSSRFVKNNATKGGAIWTTNQTSIYNSNFTANDAVFGGAIYWFGEHGLLDGSKFFKNTAIEGGAIYYDGDFNQILNSEFRFNHADYGSALFFDDRGLVITSTILLENQANSTSLLTSYNTTNDTIVIEAILKGGDNLMNAIYTLSSNYVLNDVTYWGVGGELNSDVNVPVISDLEANQNISVELYSHNTLAFKAYNATDINGYMSISVPMDFGRYVVLVLHDENNYYTSINNTGIVEFELLDPFVGIDVRDIFYKENATVKIEFVDGVTGNVTIAVDGVNYTNKSIDERILTFVIPNLSGGIHNITAFYSGNDYYHSDSRSASFNVKPLPSQIDVSSEGGYYKSPIVIDVTVNPLDSTGNVVLIIENEYGAVLNITDVHTFSEIVNNLTAGIHNITVYYTGNSNYSPSSNSTLIEIKPIDLVANAYANPQTLYSTSNPVFAIEVPSEFNGKVRITVGDVSKVYDVVGSTNLIFDKLAPGNKTATIEFFDDNNYKNSTLTASFSVVKAEGSSGSVITVNAEDMTRGYNSPYDYQAAFLDAQGNALKNTTVVFKVNGKEYSVKTNESGIAQLTVSKLAVGTYDITSFNPVTGYETVKKLKIVKRITENKDLKVDFDAGKNFAVKVIGDNGKIAPENDFVYIKISKYTFVSKIDKTGHAKLKITLKPGKYTIVTTYKGFTAKNKLVVNKILKVVKKTTTIKKGQKLVLSAKLVGSNGKAIKGKVVQFKFNGKIYKAKTNKKGIAKVTIKSKVTKKLKKGKKYSVGLSYTVKVKFGVGVTKVSDTAKCYVKVRK